MQTPVAKLPKPARREFKAVMREIRILRARYDAAVTNEHNAAHWSMADDYSPRKSHSPEVLKRIRERSRYEVGSNSWLSGMVDTLANHTIGLGPRLRILDQNEAACERVQNAWSRWCKDTGFVAKLLTAKKSQIVSGEGIGRAITNKKLPSIQLDVRLYEPDQLSGQAVDPWGFWNEDGVRVDPETRNPDQYFLLNYHPGDDAYGRMNEGKWHDAANVFHYFRCDRPGQTRGIPLLTPALPLIAILRRFTLASLKAAETAASHTNVLKTTSAGIEAAGSPADFEPIDIEHGMTTILPEGWDITQMDAKHPNTTYEMVVRVILNEVARCISQPLNIAMCNSAGYNYSSGRLDHQTYYKSIEVDQSVNLESTVVDKTFRWWLDEAVFIDGLLDGLPPFDLLAWEWCWDAQPVIDENVDANAAQTRLKSGRSTLPIEWQRQGYSDFKVQLKKGAEALGIKVEDYQRLLQMQLFGTSADQLPVTAIDATNGETAQVGAVQDTALNGAQITGIMAIITQVVTGQLPVESADPLIRAAFPAIDPDRVTEILKPIKEFKPPLLGDGTPNPALAEQATEIDGTPSASAGVFTGTKRRDFSNNQKAIQDVLDAFMNGASEAMATVQLGRLGLSPDDIKKLIDDSRDGVVDSLSSQLEEATP